MKIIIIGATETGLTLANLLGEENDVTIIDNNEEHAKNIAHDVHALVVFGEGSDVALLNEAGLQEADAIVTTVDDKTNLMICEIAKSQNIGKIIALINEPKNEELFIKLGVTNLVSKVGTNVTAIKRMLNNFENERIVCQLGKGDLQIVEMTLSPESKLVGKNPEIKNGVIAGIYREGQYIIPDKNAILEANDVLVVATKTDNLSEITQIISKK